MQTTLSIIAVLTFISLAAIFLIIRIKTNGKYELKLIDILMAILPIIIWLFVSGKISELQLGDLSVKLHREFEKKVVLEKTLNRQFKLDVKRSMKIATDYNYSIEDDITNKHPSPGGTSYRYIVMEQECNSNYEAPKFWAIISFEDYRELVLSSYSTTEGKEFLLWVKHKDISKLKKIPSFVTQNNAITLETDKLTALEKMNNLNIDFLPVIDESRKYLGVVTKTDLTSSFLISLGKQLNK